MAKIQPVSSWYNGQEQQATDLYVVSSYDNLIDSAQFSYRLTLPKVGPEAIALVSGILNITGQDYIDWNANPDINAAAYTLTAEKLNLVLLPE
jgi:hypothetical protein